MARQGVERRGRGRIVQGCFFSLGGLSILAAIATCAVFALLGGIYVVTTQAITQAMSNLPTPTRIGGYSAAALQQYPEAQLIYPGADILATYADEQASGLAKPWYAIVRCHAGTQASRQAVAGWYSQQLEARGWVPLPSDLPAASPSQRRVLVWQRGDLLFRLIFGSTSPVYSTAATPESYATLFSTELTPRR